MIKYRDLHHFQLYFGHNQAPQLPDQCGYNPAPLPAKFGHNQAPLPVISSHNQATLPVIFAKEAQAFQLFRLFKS